MFRDQESKCDCMSIRQFIFVWYFLPLSAVVLAAGCDGTTGDGYTGGRGQVSGIVTLNGVPVARGCKILFVGAEKGVTAGGIIGDDGHFDLVYERGAGLPVGEYMVQLSAPYEVPSAGTPKSYGSYTEVQEEAKAAMSALKGQKLADDGPFPAKYGSTQTSKLRANVVDGKNEVNFDLVR